MNRRTDSRTAELVQIALLTRAAFEQSAAERYALVAGVPPDLIYRVFARRADHLRKAGVLGCPRPSDGRRRRPRA